MKIVLASTSPRRRELIKKLGYDIEVAAPDCDENIGITDPAEYVKALAERKAFSVSGEIVIGADTVVVAPDGTLLGKPDDAIDAESMFRRLCGKSHKVMTGVCVRCGDKALVDYEVTGVTFKPYDTVIIDKYIKSGKCFGKAGAYGLQDEEIRLMTERIDGDFDNVIGLPVGLLSKMLDKFLT